MIVHDADSGTTAIFGHSGDSKTAKELAERLSSPMPADDTGEPSPVVAAADTTRDEYIAAVEQIREHIREGITYQTNLTRQISARLPQDAKPRDIYRRLRRRNPAPFAAYIERPNSTVISASPERFFRYRADSRRIDTSPVKGTRPRGSTAEEDLALKCELLNSRKDRAENTMIVDLLRNDIGRIAEFGSVEVKELCARNASDISSTRLDRRCYRPHRHDAGRDDPLAFSLRVDHRGTKDQHHAHHRFVRKIFPRLVDGSDRLLLPAESVGLGSRDTGPERCDPHDGGSRP